MEFHISGLVDLVGQLLDLYFDLVFEWFCDVAVPQLLDCVLLIFLAQIYIHQALS